MSLNNKVILVTGAAKRIGRGIALRLAREGARVAIHYNGSESEARKTAAECGNAPIFKANLESVADIQRLFQDIRGHFGRLDGLVNFLQREAVRNGFPRTIKPRSISVMAFSIASGVVPKLASMRAWRRCMSPPSNSNFSCVK